MSLKLELLIIHTCRNEYTGQIGSKQDLWTNMLWVRAFLVLRVLRQFHFHFDFFYLSYTNTCLLKVYRNILPDKISWFSPIQMNQKSTHCHSNVTSTYCRHTSFNGAMFWFQFTCVQVNYLLCLKYLIQECASIAENSCESGCHSVFLQTDVLWFKESCGVRRCETFAGKL